MSPGAPIRIECPACGHRHEFAAGAGPSTLPHHCPRCGADLVADGLLTEATDDGTVSATQPVAEPETGLAPWFPAPAGLEAAAVAVFAALLAWSHLTRGFLAAALDGADLVFHEAGHPIFGIFGFRFLGYLGGTLGQLAFPVAAAFGFARTRRPASFAVAVVWIGFNLVNVGTYAADASARALPLLTPDPDSHDWWNMLGTLGVRDHCRGIGGTIQALGWLLWIAAPAWALWRRVRALRQGEGGVEP